MPGRYGGYGGYDEEEFTAEYYDSAYDHIRTGDIAFYIEPEMIFIAGKK